MDLFSGSRYLVHLFIMILVCWLGWLCGLAFGQLGEALTGSANFPDIGLTCLGNLVAFFVLILESKASVVEWVKFVAADQKTHKWNISEVEGGRTTCTPENLSDCSVVMLCPTRPFPILTGMMRYMSNDHGVQSIFLQCGPLQSANEVPEENLRTCHSNHTDRCGCIVFKTVEDVTKRLAHRIPGTLKRLSKSLCLLPCQGCRRNGCHGCNHGLLKVENDILTETRDSEVESPAAVCELLDRKSIHKGRTCICIPVICIPVRSADDDEWTNELIKILKPHNKEFRGSVIRKGGTSVSSALENYKNGNKCDAVEKYKVASLFIVPKLIFSLIIFVLTFWFKVDGFSSVPSQRRQ